MSNYILFLQYSSAVSLQCPSRHTQIIASNFCVPDTNVKLRDVFGYKSNQFNLDRQDKVSLLEISGPITLMTGRGC